jgi:hypothetical protein
MINRTFSVRGKTVFIDRAETDAEDAWLSTLARQTRHFGTSCRKTGLWIELETMSRGRKVLAMSLNKLADLSDEEKALLFIACER